MEGAEGDVSLPCAVCGQHARSHVHKSSQAQRDSRRGSCMCARGPDTTHVLAGARISLPKLY
eukprot:scaffold7350_cov121-Isochrysis_galbana.AAC.3